MIAGSRSQSSVEKRVVIGCSRLRSEVGCITCDVIGSTVRECYVIGGCLLQSFNFKYFVTCNVIVCHRRMSVATGDVIGSTVRECYVIGGCLLQSFNFKYFVTCNVIVCHRRMSVATSDVIGCRTSRSVCCIA